MHSLLEINVDFFFATEHFNDIISFPNINIKYTDVRRLQYDYYKIVVITTSSMFE